MASAAALALAVCTAFAFSESAVRQSQARVEEAKATGETMDARQRAQDEREQLRHSPEVFMRGVMADAARFGIDAPTYDELRAVNRHVVHVRDAITLSPGRSYRSEHLEITAAVEKVRYQRHGAIVSARHAIAKVRNTSEHHVAYLLRLRSSVRGNCEVRGARTHNAMSLMPGEQADIVVCAGGGAIRIEHLEVMEVTPLGHVYLSQLPPSAVGHDPSGDSAHRPAMEVTMCTTFDARALGVKVREGQTRWSDVADFFSRHSCERFGFPSDYRRAEQALMVLPAAPVDADPSHSVD